MHRRWKGRSDRPLHRRFPFPPTFRPTIDLDAVIPRRARPLVRLLALCGLAAIVACGDSATAPTTESVRLPSIRGRWEGQLQPYPTEVQSVLFTGSLTVEIEMDLAGNLEGFGWIRDGIVSGPRLDLEGRIDPPIVQFRLRRDGEIVLVVAGESDDFGGVMDATYLFDTPEAYERNAGAGVVRLLKRNGGA